MQMEFVVLDRDPRDFQQPVAADVVLMMCRRAFGADITVERAAELTFGMFNTTFLVEMNGRKVILRVGPHPGAEVFANERDLMRKEYTLQPYLGAYSDLAPRTLFADFSRELLPRDYVFQEYIEGELWDAVDKELSDGDRDSLWRQLAAIALRIHATDGESFGFPFPGTQHTAWGDFIIDNVTQMRDDILRFGVATGGVPGYLTALTRGKKLLDAIEAPKLLHGDLWPKNVLIDRTQSPPKIVGLLDSERGLWGDPLAEWIFYFLEVPDAFWEAYGQPPEDAATRFRMAAYHGMYCVQLFLEAYRFGWDRDEFDRILAAKTAEMTEITRSIAN